MGLLDITEECQEAIDEWSGVVGKPSGKNAERVRLRVFKNRLIEDYLATAHPILPGLWVLPLATVTTWFSLQNFGVALTLAITVVGILSWTLMEYVLHRWLFHRVPSSWEFDKVQMFMLHGYHHEFPNDPWRLVAPPIMAWPVTLIVGAILVGVLGAPLGSAYLGGIALGYLSYDWIHYYEHHGKPKGRYGKMLRRLHSIHHFQDSEVNHGISSPLWDFVLRTFRDGAKKASAAADLQAPAPPQPES